MLSKSSETSQLAVKYCQCNCSSDSARRPVSLAATASHSSVLSQHRAMSCSEPSSNPKPLPAAPCLLPSRIIVFTTSPLNSFLPTLPWFFFLQEILQENKTQKQLLPVASCGQIPNPYFNWSLFSISLLKLLLWLSRQWSSVVLGNHSASSSPSSFPTLNAQAPTFRLGPQVSSFLSQSMYFPRQSDPNPSLSSYILKYIYIYTHTYIYVGGYTFYMCIYIYMLVILKFWILAPPWAESRIPTGRFHWAVSAGRPYSTWSWTHHLPPPQMAAPDGLS